jgi:hypothetical protein
LFNAGCRDLDGSLELVELPSVGPYRTIAITPDAFDDFRDAAFERRVALAAAVEQR